MLTIYSAAVSVAHRINFTQGLTVAQTLTAAAESAEFARTLAELYRAGIMPIMTQLACLSGVAANCCGYISKISRVQCVKLRPVATNPVQVEKNLNSGSSADKSL